MGTEAVALRVRRNFGARQTLPPASPELMLMAEQTISDRPSMTLYDAPIESFEGRWHVVQTKWREEKAFAEFLATRLVPFFLPLKRSKDRWRNVVWTALFPSYCFFCGGDVERFAVLDSGLCLSNNAVTSILSCARQGQLRDDLSRIRQQQLERPEMITTFKPGTPIKVLRGPWEGKEGFIERDTGRAIIIFRSAMFGASSVPFEVDRADVEIDE